jgi:hypothetical protein
MEVPRMAVRVLEPESPFTKVDAARDTGIDHPLQRPVNRRAADPRIITANQIDEMLGADVSLLAEEHVDDEVTLAGTPAARGTEFFDELGRGRNCHELGNLGGERTIRSRRWTWRSGS